MIWLFFGQPFLNPSDSSLELTHHWKAFGLKQNILSESSDCNRIFHTLIQTPPGQYFKPPDNALPHPARTDFLKGKKKDPIMMKILSLFQSDKRNIDANVKKKEEDSVRCTIYAKRTQRET